MKLWKADTTNWVARQVVGEPYPGRDEDGETCYENTHFASKPEALDRLKKEAEAMVSLSARGLLGARERLRECETECGNAAIALHKANLAAEAGEDKPEAV